MEKTKNHLDLLWIHTRNIDTWITEEISFAKNAWEQRVSIGSCLISVHDRGDGYDRIRYDRSQRTGHKGTDDDDAIFAIHFYNDSLMFVPHKVNDTDEFIRIAYNDPMMFDKLESCIWNAKAIDTILDDYRTIIENLSLIKTSLFQDKTKIVSKDHGEVCSLMAATAKLEKHVRTVSRSFIKNPAAALNEFGRQRDLDEIPTYSANDDIPF
jgi:hypothetical protein